MLKHRLLTMLVVVAMMAVMAAGVSADDNRKFRPTTQQSAPAICFVAGRYFLTPAEGLRRIGSWTESDAASNDCPSALARIPFDVGFIPNREWAVR